MKCGILRAALLAILMTSCDSDHAVRSEPGELAGLYSRGDFLWSEKLRIREDGSYARKFRGCTTSARQEGVVVVEDGAVVFLPSGSEVYVSYTGSIPAGDTARNRLSVAQYGGLTWLFESSLSQDFVDAIVEGRGAPWRKTQFFSRDDSR